MYLASWPAPAHRRIALKPRVSAAPATAAITFGANGATGLIRGAQGLVETGVAGRTHVERHLDAAGHHVDGIGRHLDAADRRANAVEVLRGIARQQHELCRRHQRIAAVRGRRRAGVRGPAGHLDAVPGNASMPSTTPTWRRARSSTGP